MQKHPIGLLNLTHGKSGTRTYEIWCGMHKRCVNPKHNRFKVYGGRGIKVCEQWKDFAVFLRDMGECPPEMSIDRINNDGNYEPSNCRWATKKEQANNMKTNRIITVDGVSKTLAQWADSIGLDQRVLHRRLSKGWDEREAVTTPNMRKVNHDR